jgi:methionyl-tRNA formyltransferase
MRVVFIGTVEGSKIALESLLSNAIAPSLVVTLPPNAAHRHSDFADVTSVALAAGCEVLHTTDINSPSTIRAIAAVAPDLCLVIGWSQICHGEFLALARSGNVGFHPASLPRLRGRAVIPWTILLDERQTGSTLFWLDDGLDSGPILSQQLFAVAADETARSLYSKHTAALADMLPKAVALIGSGEAPRIEQDERHATYCAKRTPDDGLIDWTASADSIIRLIRAVGEPYPGAFGCCRGETMWIDAAQLYPDSHRFIGLAGQVQWHTVNGFVVRCGDGACIEVRKWRWRYG